MKTTAVFKNLPCDYYPVSLEMMAVTARSRMGRPSVVTGLVLLKLRAAFLIGCSEREACIFAGIHRATLYRYQDKNPDFCDQKEAWKCWLIIQARRVIAEAIEGGDSICAWQFLRVHRAREFA